MRRCTPGETPRECSKSGNMLICNWLGVNAVIIDMRFRPRIEHEQSTQDSMRGDEQTAGIRESVMLEKHVRDPPRQVAAVHCVRALCSYDPRLRRTAVKRSLQLLAVCNTCQRLFVLYHLDVIDVRIEEATSMHPGCKFASVDLIGSD